MVPVLCCRRALSTAQADSHPPEPEAATSELTDQIAEPIEPLAIDAPQESSEPPQLTSALSRAQDIAQNHPEGALQTTSEMREARNRMRISQELPSPAPPASMSAVMREGACGVPVNL